MGKKVIGAVLVVAGVVAMAFGVPGEALFKFGTFLLAAGISIFMTPEVPESERRGIKVNNRSNIEPRRIIYGTAITSPSLVYLDTDPSSGSEVEDLLHRIVVLAGHPIESINKVYLGDEEFDINLNSSNLITSESEDWEHSNKTPLFIGVTQKNGPDSDNAKKIRHSLGNGQFGTIKKIFHLMILRFR
jgi:hypothetical protein